MEPILLNFRPEVTVEAVNQMVEASANDPDCKPEYRKIYQDIKTLVQLGVSCLSEEPLKPVPAEPGNNQKS